MTLEWINPKHILVSIVDDGAAVKKSAGGLELFTMHATSENESYSEGKYLTITRARFEQCEDVLRIERVWGEKEIQSPFMPGDEVQLQFSWFATAKDERRILPSLGDGIFRVLVPMHDILWIWRNGKPVAVRDEVLIQSDPPPESRPGLGLMMFDKERKSFYQYERKGTVVSVGPLVFGPVAAGDRVVYPTLTAKKANVDMGGTAAEIHQVAYDDLYYTEVDHAEEA